MDVIKEQQYYYDPSSEGEEALPSDSQEDEVEANVTLPPNPKENNNHEDNDAENEEVKED